jgi:putative addiction module component (TIGR02574 family)
LSPGVIGANLGERILTAPVGGGYLSIMSVATIQAEVLSLPPGERAKLIDVLWDSLASPEVASREVAWAEESERRIDAFEAGKLKARDAGTVFSDLRKDLRK